MASLLEVFRRERRKAGSRGWAQEQFADEFTGVLEQNGHRGLTRPPICSESGQRDVAAVVEDRRDAALFVLFHDDAAVRLTALGLGRWCSVRDLRYRHRDRVLF